MKENCLRSIWLVASLVFAACSPSPEDEKATVTRIAANVLATQTAAAPTLTPTATATETPTPTVTATPAPTATPTPTPLSGPVTVHLASNGSGDYSSLEAAVEALPAGSTLVLDPGSYRLVESLEIRRPLRLVGAGLDETEIVSEAEGYVVRFSGEGLFAAEDLTFRHEGEALADVVVVQGGEVELARCRFTGAVSVEEEGPRAGLRLAGSSTGLVQDCIAEENYRIGILIDNRVQATLEANICSDNEAIGILYREGAGGSAHQNQCTGNEFAGIGVTDQAQPTLEQNVCTGNEFGIVINDQAQPTLEQNVASDNAGVGIAYGGTAGGIARQNQIENNETFDVAIFDEAQPTLERNVCSAGRGRFVFSGGIISEETAKPKLIDNDCAIR